MHFSLLHPILTQCVNRFVDHLSREAEQECRPRRERLRKKYEIGV
jgi:hypothetical protein